MKYIYLHLFIYLLAISGCNRWSPSVTLTVQKNGDQVEFHFGYRNVTGLDRMLIWEKDTKKVLTEIYIPYYYGSILKYGEIPHNYSTSSGSMNSSRQTFPPNNIPPSAIPVGKEIIVRLGYIADDPFPSTSSKRFSFRINEDGTITNLGEIPTSTIIEEPVIPEPN